MFAEGMTERRAGRQGRAPVPGYLGGAQGGWGESSKGCSRGSRRGQTRKASPAPLRGLDFQGRGKPRGNFTQDVIRFAQCVVVAVRTVNYRRGHVKTVTYELQGARPPISCSTK